MLLPGRDATRPRGTAPERKILVIRDEQGSDLHG
jgi:hypothetical protein